MSPPRGEWGAYASKTCHYCSERSETDDHIVPRSAFNQPQAALPYWFRSQNVVPSCKICNNWKGSFRSSCECRICAWAWNTALAVFLPSDYVIRVRPVPPPRAIRWRMGWRP